MKGRVMVLWEMSKHPAFSVTVATGNGNGVFCQE